MQCHSIVEWMSTAIDGRLDAQRTRLLEEHLSGCEACREEFAALKHTVALLQGLPEVDPPADLPDAVRRGVGKRRGRLITGYYFARPQLRAALAAGVVALLCVFAFQRAEVGERRAEGGGPEAEVGERRTEVGERRTEVGDRISKGGGRGSEVGARKPEADVGSAAPVVAAALPESRSGAGLMRASRARAEEGLKEARAGLAVEAAPIAREPLVEEAEAEGKIWTGEARKAEDEPGLRALDREPQPEALSLLAGGGSVEQPRDVAPRREVRAAPAVEPAVEIRVQGVTEADVVRVARKVLGEGVAPVETDDGDRGGRSWRLWFGRGSGSRALSADMPMAVLAAKSASNDTVTLHAARPLFLRIPVSDYPHLLKELGVLGTVSGPGDTDFATNRVLLKLMITPE